MSKPRRSLLTVGVRRTGGHVRLTLTGDLEVSTNHLVRNAVVEACDRQPLQHLVIDLDALELLDSTGISTLIWARQAALANGIAFVVINCHGMPRRALEVTGLYSVLVGQTACGQIE